MNWKSLVFSVLMIMLPLMGIRAQSEKRLAITTPEQIQWQDMEITMEEGSIAVRFKLTDITKGGENVFLRKVVFE